jgi:hypothetical protein
MPINNIIIRDSKFEGRNKYQQKQEVDTGESNNSIIE